MRVRSRESRGRGGRWEEARRCLERLRASTIVRHFVLPAGTMASYATRSSRRAATLHLPTLMTAPTPTDPTAPTAPIATTASAATTGEAAAPRGTGPAWLDTLRILGDPIGDDCARRLKSEGVTPAQIRRTIEQTKTNDRRR